MVNDTFHDRLVSYLRHICLGTPIFLKSALTYKLQEVVLPIADIVEEEIDYKTTNLTFYIGTIGELKVVTTIQFQWEKRENGSFKLIGIF